MSTKLYFENNYPAITYFAKYHGWVEIGLDGVSSSLVRAIDEGGLVWEGKQNYKNLDDALMDLEVYLHQYMLENFPRYRKTGS